jgi:protein NRD1
VPPPTNTGATPYYGAPGSIPQAALAPPVSSVSLQNGAPPPQQPGMMQYSQPVNPAPPAQYQSNTQAPPQASEQNVPAAQPALPAAGNNDPQQQLQLLQQLAQILPPEQLAAVIAQMGFQLPAPAAAPVPQVAPQVVAQPPQNGGYDASQNGQNGYDQGRNNQDNQPRFRDRSRSPDAKRRRVTPPNRRDSPTYGVYDPNVAQNDSGRRGDFERRGDRGRGNRGNRNEFRRRTPPRDRPASPGMVPLPTQHKPPGAPKPVGHDYQIPQGRIKGILFVLLRVIHH